VKDGAGLKLYVYYAPGWAKYVIITKLLLLHRFEAYTVS